MKALFLLPALLFCLQVHGQSMASMARPQRGPGNATIGFYSSEINDSFFAFIHLPQGYQRAASRTYPVVYLLDGNYYFGRVAKMMDKYVKEGKMVPTILVAISYKDFPTMDSLRDRDYTYPTALPEYQMKASGGAPRLLSFITTQLMRAVESTYRMDTTKRILMGHSLGGFFTMYVLNQYLTSGGPSFSSYIAASPSLAYNKYYLMGELNKQHPLSTDKGSPSVYISYGSKEGEDPDPGEKPIAEDMTMLKDYFTVRLAGTMKYKGEILPGLDHMAAAMPAFGNGLIWTLKK